MDALVVPVAALALILIGIETLRWFTRPAARRLRTIKKIGGRR